MAILYVHPRKSKLFAAFLMKCILILCAVVTTQAQTPTITSFTPEAGPVGTEVTITGANFTGTTMVYVGGGSTLDFVVESDTEIRVRVPSTAYTGRIQVHTGRGTVVSATNFTVENTPVVSAFSPSSGPVGTEVTITGSGFAGATLVSIAGGSITDFTIVDDTQIKATVTSLASSGRVVVYSNEGTALSETSYTLTNGPEVNSFSPSSGPVGTEVTITGSKFTGVTSLSIAGGSVTDYTILSETQIRAIVPPSASSGRVVVNTSKGSASSSTSYSLDNAPDITSFSPASGSVGAAVTIMGAGFTDATLVYIGGGSTTEFTVVSDTQINVNVPANASTGRVQVHTKQGRAISAYNFAVEGAPVISSFSPYAGAVGSVVTIRGRNFTDANVVYIGSGSTTSFTIVSDTEIEVTVPATANSGTLRVYTNNGYTTSTGRFTVTNAPVIASFTPTSGPVGTEVTIKGENFTGTYQVYVGNGSTTTGFTVISDTEIKVRVPETATSGKLLVRTNKGQVISDGTFTVTGAPEIISFSPASGPAGALVTITGKNFTGANLVYVGSGSTTDFTVVSDTEIQARVPATASTGRIQVRSNSGTAVSSGTFTVTGAPVITSFTPASGPVGTEVTILGQNFTGTYQVYVGSGSTTTGFTVVSDTELKVTVPPLGSTGRILVRTSNGQVSSTGTFTVTGAPEILSFSPASGPAGALVTITGKNFTGANLVVIGPASTTDFTVVSDTEIQARVPATASTGRIQVRSNSGMAVSSGTFTVTGAPVITSFTPASGPVGTEVTISGENFTGTTLVYIGSGYVYAKDIISVSDTEIRLKVPAIATTGIIRVVTGTGQSTSSATFKVENPPVITSFSPTEGPVGTEITIRGQNLSGANRVFVGSGNTTAGITVVSDTEIRMIVPENATTGTLRVWAETGQAFSSGIFSVLNPVITLTPASLSFADVAVGDDEVKSYQVSGSDLTNGVPVTLNVGESTGPYTISLSESGEFKRSLELSGITNNRLSATTIYVKYAPALKTEEEAPDVGSVIHLQGSKELAALSINGTSMSPSPVELASFKAKAKDNLVVLEWRTASETNNSHFEVEMSEESLENFTKIASVESKAGNSTVEADYSFSHYYTGNHKMLYFRLKQVDVDGTFEYSKIVSAEINADFKEPELVVAPNPLTADSKVIVTATTDDKAILRLHTLDGKQVHTQERALLKGQNEISLLVADKLQSGMYILSVEFEGKIQKIKVIKR